MYLSLTTLAFSLPPLDDERPGGEKSVYNVKGGSTSGDGSITL